MHVFFLSCRAYFAAMWNRMLFLFSLILLFSLMSPLTGSAGVIVFDGVVSSDKEIKLRALTKGRFFPEGGKLVKFYLNEEHLGTSLSGGDGYAYLACPPLPPGVTRIMAERDTDSDEGILLVTGPDDRVVFVEIEAALFHSLLSPEPEKEAVEAMALLSKKFRIAYITTLLGQKTAKEWLKRNGFYLSAVIRWKGDRSLAELEGLGVKPFAFIASPAVLSGVDDVEKKYSFEKTGDGIVLKDWSDLLKQLK